MKRTAPGEDNFTKSTVKIITGEKISIKEVTGIETGPELKMIGKISVGQIILSKNVIRVKKKIPEDTITKEEIIFHEASHKILHELFKRNKDKDMEDFLRILYQDEKLVDIHAELIRSFKIKLPINQ